MSPTEGVVLDVEGLETRFGHQTVHRDLSLQVRRGEVLAIVGGSGSGKTTLLRQLLGLERPVAGRVTVFGTDLARADAAERAAIRARWGVLFQQGGLFSALGALDNVALPLRELRRLDDEVVREVAALKLSMVGIGPEHHHKRPAQLSGGMARRVGLARAIALDPELLFLDEPTAGLDPVLARGFVALLQELAAELAPTVVIITHDRETVAALASRVAVLSRGRIVALGTVADVAAVDDPAVSAFFAHDAAGASAGDTDPPRVGA
ncbi:MAG: ABC transporter ATP-binding protein [Pseudomonadota bacterium]|jgi:phospholipid/cholesterol/gamma-HCH transport system ATP-binding protein